MPTQQEDHTRRTAKMEELRALNSAQFTVAELMWMIKGPTFYSGLLGRNTYDLRDELMMDRLLTYRFVR